MPVLSKRIVLDCFYLLIFYFEKFSTDVCRLPCAVNVNLNLSNVWTVRRDQWKFDRNHVSYTDRVNEITLACNYMKWSNRGLKTIIKNDKMSACRVRCGLRLSQNLHVSLRLLCSRHLCSSAKVR